MLCEKLSFSKDNICIFLTLQSKSATTFSCCSNVSSWNSKIRISKRNVKTFLVFRMLKNSWKAANIWKRKFAAVVVYVFSQEMGSCNTSGKFLMWKFLLQMSVISFEPQLLLSFWNGRTTYIHLVKFCLNKSLFNIMF